MKTSIFPFGLNDISEKTLIFPLDIDHIWKVREELASFYDANPEHCMSPLAMKRNSAGVPEHAELPQLSSDGDGAVGSSMEAVSPPKKRRKRVSKTEHDELQSKCNMHKSTIQMLHGKISKLEDHWGNECRQRDDVIADLQEKVANCFYLSLHVCTLF